VDIPISTSTSLATRDQLFSTAEQLSLAGFLAGYSGLTRDAYALDLRQYVAWCIEHQLAVFGARRADIECFARHLESLGGARATSAGPPKSPHAAVLRARAVRTSRRDRHRCMGCGNAVARWPLLRMGSERQGVGGRWR
jgi:hypothetical protein